MSNLIHIAEIVVEPPYKPGIPIANEKRKSYGEDAQNNEKDEFP